PQAMRLSYAARVGRDHPARVDPPHAVVDVVCDVQAAIRAERDGGRGIELRPGRGPPVAAETGGRPGDRRDRAGHVDPTDAVAPKLGDVERAVRRPRES